jgi:hypothetical protein
LDRDPAEQPTLRGEDQMRAKHTLGLTALLIAVAALLLIVAQAQAYDGPMWTIGESDVSESTTVKSKSSVNTFEDSKTGAGAAKVECKVTTEDKVNSSGKGEITAFTASECLSVKVCSGTITVLAVHLPWHTQLEEVEEKVRTIISSGGSGQPGVLVECTVLGIPIKDECTGETTTADENTTGGTNVIFDSKSTHLSCSVGGAGAGVIGGTELVEATLKLNVGVPITILAGTATVTAGSVVLITSNVTITFENLTVAQQIWLNGIQDIPGVLTLNELNNFALFGVGGKACGLALLPFPATCQINITSAAAGRLGEYEVEYGARISVLFLIES